MTRLSPAYLNVIGTRPRQLRAMMLRGQRPDAANLAGWEFRGVNMPATSRLLGLRRFIKGFVSTADGSVVGYNKQVAGADLSAPWTPRPQRDGRVAFAYFSVSPVDPEAVDNRLLNAQLLDYSAGPSPERGIAGHLRDYLVQVTPGADDLLLGQAFLAVGNRRIPVGWFALERLGRAEHTS